jgi:hypothetical protein
VDTHVVDITWRMIKPTKNSFSDTMSGSAQGMDLASLKEQRKKGGAYWMRLWVTGETWAPAWVKAECNVQAISGADYDGQKHLPIWNACLWDHALKAYKELFVDTGILADPNLKMVYAPGGFTWAEFDYEMISQAVSAGQLDWATFEAWHKKMLKDLVTLFGPHANKLVFTGEDYPAGPFGTKDDLLARDAVVAGMGIRTGITEVVNNHLSQTPAYGMTIAPNGHVNIDENWPTVRGDSIAATENECYNACGFTAKDLYYAVRQSNLKALQMRMSWLYVVPDDSYLSRFPEHWRWVRKELARTREDAPDAWAVLREAEDKHWADDSSLQWEGKPYVKNWERFLVQRDAAPDGKSQRGTDKHIGELDPSNGTAYEGRRTDPANGQHALYFDVDSVFAQRSRAFDLKVTLRSGPGTIKLKASLGGQTVEAMAVPTAGGDKTQTLTFHFADARLDGQLPGNTDFALVDDGTHPIEVEMVRLILP